MRGKIGFTALCIAAFLAWSGNAAQAESAVRIFAVYPTRTENSVTISWRTDPQSKGSVEYADHSGEWKRTPWSDAFTEQHVFTIFNLQPATTYLYRINAELEDGTTESKTGDFTTLDSSVVNDGTSQVLGGSFQAVLTPSVTPGPPQYQPYYPDQQQYYPYQYIPIPYPVNMQYPQSQVLAEQVVVPTEVPTNTPEPTVTQASSTFSNENALNLIVGIVLGVSASFLLHQLTKRRAKKEDTSKSSKFDQKESEVEVIEDEDELTEYSFEVKKQES